MLKRPVPRDRRGRAPKQTRTRRVYLYVGNEIRYAWDAPINTEVARCTLDWVRLHTTKQCFLSNSADMPVGGKKTAKQTTSRNQSSADWVEEIDIRD